MKTEDAQAGDPRVLLHLDVQGSHLEKGLDRRAVRRGVFPGE